MISDSDLVGVFEGELCRRNGCTGYIETHPVKNCSCHLNPPCGACCSPRNFCPECEWEEADDPPPPVVMRPADLPGVWGSVRTTPLDPTKIDYRHTGGTNSSMHFEGVYPPGTSSADVEKKVIGTFGGRFESFGNGRFKYIAYTD